MGTAYEEVLSFLEMPSNYGAILDWATGIIRVNRNYEQWEAICLRKKNRAPTMDDKILLETITHETTHFLQISTTGFLYSFAIELFGQVRKCVPAPITDFSGITSSPPKLISKQICSTLDRLDVAGAEGVTIRSIVESGAFLVQKRTHWPNLTAEGFGKMLDRECPAPEYRLAYDVSMRYLGKEAFDCYPIIAYLSLCTDSPPDAFVILCKDTVSRGLRIGEGLDVPPFLELLNIIVTAYGFKLIGTSAEAAENLPRHPIYTQMVIQLNNLCEQSGFSVTNFMAAPYRITEMLAIESVRPMLFNKKMDRYWYLYVPDHFLPTMSREEKELETKALLLLAAISSKILSGVE
ncbi:MAG: hypothetical protein AMJ73_04505 [candidate division Zixibacteria bacterium SM1_73]|nr:MAG: hypothetical protein AMJ73_04505 [candidate division Zixibacteria bacterium SM1_73]